LLKKTVSGIMLFLLLVSTLTLAFNILPIKASGTIYIRADGSIDPPTAPIQRDGDYYTLTGNITSDTDGIVIERNNMTLDGAGYTVQGPGKAYAQMGIILLYRSNVTIKNARITDFDHGIHIEISPNNTIAGNNVTNNGVGIILHKSGANTNTIVGNNITNNANGIIFAIVNNNTISGNKITNNQNGIYLSGSNYNSIFGNNVTANSNYYGISLYGCSSNSISGNNIIANNYYGIWLYSSSNNSISGNNIANNGYGIWLSESSNYNMIYHNNFIDNSDHVHIFGSYGNTWDDGYPSGGNYWSDYTDVDLYSGPYQNEAGSDGMWDHSYVIDGNNKDQYPLVNPWMPTHIWPMFQHDPQHTGRSEYLGPESIEVSWAYDLGLFGPNRVMSMQPIIGPGGVIYFGVGEVGPSPWGKLYAFNPDGTKRWEFSNLTNPAYIPTVAPDGTIYVSTGSSGIYALNSDGTEKWRFSPEGMGVPESTTIGLDGTLYFMAYVSTEGGQYCLYSLDSNGSEKWVAFGPRGGLTSPAIGRDGTLYAVWTGFRSLTDETRGVLVAYYPNGTLKWSQPLEFDASSPAIGPEGNIYVVTGSHGYFGTLRSLYAFDRNGTKLWQSYPWEYGSLFTPVISPNGNIIVADRWSEVIGESWGWYVWGPRSRIQTFSPDGNMLWTLGPDVDITIETQPILDADGAIFVGRMVYEGWPPGPIGYRLDSIDANGAVKWSFNVSGWSGEHPGILGTPVLGSGGYLYASLVEPQDSGLYSIRLCALGQSARPDFSISASPTSLTVQQGSSDTSTVTIGSVNGFDQPVQLTVSGAPSGVTATSNPQQVTPPAEGSISSTLTVSADTTAPLGSYSLNVTGTSDALTHSTYISLEITASSDVVHPALIENFAASSAEDKQVTLRWTNPPDSDLAEVVVLCKIEEYPDNHLDGELVYRNTLTLPSAQIEFVDSALVNGRTYGYAVFGRDSAGNWNDHVIEGNNAAMATPSNPSNQHPQARFTYSPTEADLTRTYKRITFDASSSWDDDEITLFEWDWDYNDGDSRYDWSTSQSEVTFVFEETGTYRVRLKVTDSDGATDTYDSQITISGWNWLRKLGGDYPHPEEAWQITSEDYQYIKSQLHIVTLENPNDFGAFGEYYDDSTVGIMLHWEHDSNLKKALNMEIDPIKSPGLTYGLCFLNALRETEKVDLIWTEGHKLKASKYFSGLLDENSGWTTQRTAEGLVDVLVEMLSEMVKDQTILGYVGIEIVRLVADCRKFEVPFKKLVELLYDNSLNWYLHRRHDDGLTHAQAWDEITVHPMTQDAHIPPTDAVKLARIENYFRGLYEKYGEHLNDLDSFQWEAKKDLRFLLSKILEMTNLVGHVVVVPHSPVEMRVFDGQGNVTGIVNGELIEYIPGSACDNETGRIIVLSPSDNNYFEAVGTGLGSYGLEIALVKNGTLTLFAANDIPTMHGSTHRYMVDWAALSLGEEGVTIQVDSNGDGIFEHTFISDSELTQSEYVIATDNTPPETQLNIGEPKSVVNGVTYLTSVTPTELIAEDNLGGCGVASIAYRIHNASYDSGWKTYTHSFLLVGLSDGVYHMDYKSTDCAGNVELTHTIQVTLFSWNYIFEDTYGRGTTLKINIAYKFFQFITPDKDYGIIKATYMRQSGRAIIIAHLDKQLQLITTAVDTKLDFCIAVAWDLQTRKQYFLIDKLGIEK
jgi:parallel beta-helix repeat protein